MRNTISALAFAISYFTVIPFHYKDINWDDNLYKNTLFFLPVVGLTLAVVSILVFMFLSSFVHPLYAAFVASVVYLFLYGFLHLEGMIDVIDAWFASYSDKDIYKIIKEPTIGAIGALATFAFVLLKVGILVYLFYEKKFDVIIISLMFSRLSLVYVVEFFDFSKNGFISKAYAHKEVGKIKIYTLFFVLFALFLSIKAIFLLAFGFLCFYFCLKIIDKRFGFVNGDCLGFSIETTELLLLNIGLVLL